MRNVRFRPSHNQAALADFRDSEKGLSLVVVGLWSDFSERRLGGCERAIVRFRVAGDIRSNADMNIWVRVLNDYSWGRRSACVAVSCGITRRPLPAIGRLRGFDLRSAGNELTAARLGTPARAGSVLNRQGVRPAALSRSACGLVNGCRRSVRRARGIHVSGACKLGSEDRGTVRSSGKWRLDCRDPGDPRFGFSLRRA